MSESVILCEGFHDRAFWDGWLTYLGCKSDGFKPGTTGYPASDPWGDKVRGGQFAYRSKSDLFIRLRPCNGKSNLLREIRVRLSQRSTKPLRRLILNVDADTIAVGAPVMATGLRQQGILHRVQQLDPGASLNAEGHIEVDGGTVNVALIRWETTDPPAPGLPDQQTLERLVCAALAAAYPQRATSVQDWLDKRADRPPLDPKEHAWSYMAGWYAEHGCEDFYANLWRDAKLASELEARLRSSGAWQIAETLAG